jgi:hypothetical protein
LRCRTRDQADWRTPEGARTGCNRDAVETGKIEVGRREAQQRPRTGTVREDAYPVLGAHLLRSRGFWDFIRGVVPEIDRGKSRQVGHLTVGHSVSQPL